MSLLPPRQSAKYKLFITSCLRRLRPSAYGRTDPTALGGQRGSASGAAARPCRTRRPRSTPCLPRRWRRYARRRGSRPRNRLPRSARSTSPGVRGVLRCQGHRVAVGGGGRGCFRGETVVVDVGRIASRRICGPPLMICEECGRVMVTRGLIRAKMRRQDAAHSLHETKRAQTPAFRLGLI